MKSVALIALVAIIYAAFLINESDGRRSWIAGDTNGERTCNQNLLVEAGNGTVTTRNLTITVVSLPMNQIIYE